MQSAALAILELDHTHTAVVDAGSPISIVDQRLVTHPVNRVLPNEGLALVSVSGAPLPRTGTISLTIEALGTPAVVKFIVMPAATCRSWI